jgi:hypothetical protein
LRERKKNNGEDKKWFKSKKERKNMLSIYPRQIDKERIMCVWKRKKEKKGEKAIEAHNNKERKRSFLNSNWSWVHINIIQHTHTHTHTQTHTHT